MVKKTKRKTRRGESLTSAESPTPTTNPLTEEESDQTEESQFIRRMFALHFGEVSGSRRPIESLPDELLLAIFAAGQRAQWMMELSNVHKMAESMRVLGEESPKAYPQLIRRVSFPMLVSHVSHRWREVAAGAPILWKDIHLLFSQRPSMLVLHLYRSRLLPLDVLINDDLCRQMETEGVHTSLKPSELRELLRLLISQAHRFRRLTIQSGFSEVIYQTVSTLRKIAVPLLEHFSIIRDTTIEWNEEWQGRDQFWEIFQGGAPRLSSVRLLEMSLHCCWLPTNAVTVLELTGAQRSPMAISLHCAKFKALLVALPSLKHLKLTGWLVEFRGESIPSAVELKSLLSIDFTPDEDKRDEMHWSTYAFKIFSSISAPALESISLSNMATAQRRGFLNALQDRPQSLQYPDLRSLRLRSQRPHELPDEDFISAFTTVVHLDVDDAICERILGLIDRNKDRISSMILPNLRTVAISFYHHRNEQVSLALRTLIKSRKAIGKPLLKVHLNFPFFNADTSQFDWLHNDVELVYRSFSDVIFE